MGHHLGTAALRGIPRHLRLTAVAAPGAEVGTTTRPSRLTVGVGLYTGQDPAGTAAGADLSAAPVLARTAEEAGFDAFWVSEHHGWQDGYLPSPLPLLAAAAAVTRRITLATGVVLAPLRHPVQLAEDAAVVDRLSGGRLLLGLGAGYLRHEFDAVGVDLRHRGTAVAEAVEICRAAWRGERFSFAGTLHQLDDVQVTPRPHEGRQIPIWLGGYAPAALARARRIADGHLIGRGDAEVIGRTDASLRAVAPPDGGFTVGVNLITVLDEPGCDAAGALRALAVQQAGYERWQRTADPFGGGVDVGTGDDALALGGPEAYVHCSGDAAAVVAQALQACRPLAAWSHVHLVLRALFPETDLEAQVTRLRRLGQALPALRAGWTT